MLSLGGVILANDNSLFLSTTKLPFIKQKVPLSVVVFLLSSLLVLLAWNGWEQYAQLKKSQTEIMQRSSWAAANEISNYVEQMENNIRMFADVETESIENAKKFNAINSEAIAILNRKVSNTYPDALNFLIWDQEGKLIIDSEGTQKNKPEVYLLPSISDSKIEYAVRMHHDAERVHFNIVVPWIHENNFLGIFGISFPSELMQPLLYKHQNADYQLVLWRQDAPGMVELMGLNAELELVNDIYLEPEDMQRVGAVAAISGTQWDVVSLHELRLFANELKNIILSGAIKFLATMFAVLLAFYIYTKQTKLRYEAREKARKKEERLQLALESTQDGVWEIDLNNEKYYFDDRWFEMLGYSSSDFKVHKNPWESLIHNNDVEESKNVFNSHLRGEISFYEHEHRLKHKNGEWRWLHDRGRILERSENGKPLRVIGISSDITKRKQAEIALRRHEDALHSFYSITSIDETSLHNQIQCLLVSGCQYLQMKCGIFSYIEGDRYTVMQVHTTSPNYKVQSGDKFELGLTYCQITIQSRGALGFSDASKTDVMRHPAYEALKLEAYLGAAVYLDGKPYGTLNFTSIEPRKEEFSDSEKQLVQMIAEWISNKLQNQFAEQRQKETSKKLALHLENSPTAIIEWNADMTIKRWSEQAEAILGWSEADVKGKMPQDWPLIHLMQKEFLQELQLQMKQSCETSNQFLIEFKGSPNNIKHLEWVTSESTELINTNNYTYLTLVQDVTERVEIQQELYESQNRLNDLYENAPDMYFSIDVNGIIQSVNQFAAEYLGYEKKELLNKPIWNLMHENDIRRANRHLNVVFEDQVKEFEMEVRMLTKEGELINTHHRLRLIEAHSGMPRELRVLCRDITERSSSQKERLDHVKIQRDEVGREMQHRIKNNLQAIVGLLKVNLDVYPQLHDVLVTSINQIDTISIVNNLMIDSEYKLVNLLELVKRITQASSKLFSQEVTFEVLYNDQEYIELWEEETVAISLIISELVTNAMKHLVDDYSGADSLRISMCNHNSSIAIEIANKISSTEKEFNVHEHMHNGGVGMGMMHSLMPPQGAELEYKQKDNYVHAILTLHEPVILNMHASELDVLEAVS